MRIFITGATGFIGKHVAKKLHKDGHGLIILVRGEIPEDFPLKPSSKTKFIQGSLSDIPKWKNKLKKLKPEAAVHLAWESMRDTGFKMSVKNLINSLSLIEALNEAGCKMIIGAGTQWEYGHDKTGKIKEDAPREPYNALAAAKIGIDLLGEKMATENNSRFIWLRFFTVYGPGQRPGALIPVVANSFKTKKFAEVKSIDAKHDFVYVEDVAEAVVAVVKKCKAQTAVYNIGSGRLTKVGEIVSLILKEYPGSRIEFPKNKAARKKSHIVSGLYADISAIRKATGWRPKTSIKSGVRKTIAYFKTI